MGSMFRSEERFDHPDQMVLNFVLCSTFRRLRDGVYDKADGSVTCDCLQSLKVHQIVGYLLCGTTFGLSSRHMKKTRVASRK